MYCNLVGSNSDVTNRIVTGEVVGRGTDSRVSTGQCSILEVPLIRQTQVCLDSET